MCNNYYLFWFCLEDYKILYMKIIKEVNIGNVEIFNSHVKDYNFICIINI